MQLRHDMLTHGVYIISAQYEGEYRGLAVAWSTQLATDRIMICVGDQSATREFILTSGAFGFNVLTSSQLEIARLFGRKSSLQVDKFKNLPVHTAETGSPLLDDCAAAFDCHVEAVHDDRNEKLIVGRILSAERFLDHYEPLIYREEDY